MRRIKHTQCIKRFNKFYKVCIKLKNGFLGALQTRKEQKEKSDNFGFTSIDAVSTNSHDWLRHTTARAITSERERKKAGICWLGWTFFPPKIYAQTDESFGSGEARGREGYIGLGLFELRRGCRSSNHWQFASPGLRSCKLELNCLRANVPI